MKFKLTKLEKNWVLYDVGELCIYNDGIHHLPNLLQYPCRGNAGISDVDYLAYWGYAVSISTLLVALIGPTLGAVADIQNYKEKDLWNCYGTWNRRVYSSGIPIVLVLVPRDLHSGKDWLFFESCIL